MLFQLLPAYHLFAQAILFMDLKDPDAAQDALKSANDILRAALKYFFNTMVDSKMSHTVWMVGRYLATIRVMRLINLSRRMSRASKDGLLKA